MRQWRRIEGSETGGDADPHAARLERGALAEIAGLEQIADRKTVALAVEQIPHVDEHFVAPEAIFGERVGLDVIALRHAEPRPHADPGPTDVARAEAERQRP